MQQYQGKISAIQLFQDNVRDKWNFILLWSKLRQIFLPFKHVFTSKGGITLHVSKLWEKKTFLFFSWFLFPKA